MQFSRLKMHRAEPQSPDAAGGAYSAPQTA